MDLLNSLELAVTDILSASIAVLLSISFSILLHNIAKDIAAGIMLRKRGLRLYEVVKLNGEMATIVKMDLVSITLLIKNGLEYDEYRTIMNSRVSFMDLRRMVVKIKDTDTT